MPASCSFQCDRSSAYDRFFDLVESPMDPTIAIIGAGCSTASEPVAEISPYWSVPMVCMYVCRQGRSKRYGCYGFGRTNFTLLLLSSRRSSFL